MMRARAKFAWMLAGACLFAWPIAGCVRTTGAEIRHRAEVAERERKPDLLLARAKAFAQIGDYTRAEQYIDAARQNGARDREVLSLLLEVCIKDQRYRAALEHTEDYLRKRPSEYRLRFMLASLHLALGEPEPARRELETVLRFAPTHAEAHYTLAVLLRDALGQPQAADAHFREYLKLSPQGIHMQEAADSLLERIP
jgi:tetratricopeptide (TPR) repeat protein